MKYYLSLLFCVSSCLLAAQDFNLLHIAWTQAVNEDLRLSTQYAQKSICYCDGSLIQGADSISVYLSSRFGENIKGFKSLHIEAQRKSRFMEIVRLVDEQDQTFVQFIAWKQMGDKWIREFEMIMDEAEVDSFDETEIDAARNTWVEFSNAHDHLKLIETSYTEDGIYVNNGKYYEGRSSIAPRYSYMSNPSWKITLKGLFVLPISNDQVIEIGQFTSSGTGLYVILWERQTEDWQAQLDFNF